jgi:hypothetical protein
LAKTDFGVRGRFGCTPTLKAELFALLEARILAGKQATGRTGMDLWQMLVLGVVRLGLDADWDRMEPIANYDALVRQLLGVPAAPWGEADKRFGHQTLRDNVARLDAELLQQINAAIAAAGREVFAKIAGAPGAALAVKVDSYGLERDVHFPTDLNLLWDAGRKCVDLVEGLRDSGYDLPGWRKFKAWRRQLKACERAASQIVYRGGPNKAARVKSAVRAYLAVGRELSAKVRGSLLGLCDQAVCASRWERLAYFHAMLDQHLDLVERRLLNEETIPAHEKVFSLFAPHTEWIQKGKQRPNVELGHRLLVATEQHQIIQDYDVLLRAAEVEQSIPVTDRLLGRYGAGSVASLSFDKGFTRAADRELLRLYVPMVVMPKRGGNGAGERAAVHGVAPPTQRGREQPQQSGASRLESLSGRGLGRLPALCGVRGDELQPARHWRGITAAGKIAPRHPGAGGLKPPATKPVSKSDRCRVVVAGEF